MSDVEPVEPEFAHDEVRLRVPAGTDPLAAIREAMGAFMERTDGTNALPWWTRVRWWHGGPAGFNRGSVLLPPSQTGVIPGLPITDRDSVYITSDRDKALLFAARHDQPRLFEVTKIGEPYRDDVLPGDESCWRCKSATVYRIEVPSKLELRRVLYELES